MVQNTGDKMKLRFGRETGQSRVYALPTHRRTVLLMKTLRVEIPNARIEALCQEWQVQEMSLFGSVVRSDFTPTSDVDVLVTFHPEARWNLWDLADMRDDLKEIFHHEIDLIEERSLVNPYLRASILRDKQVIYAAG